MRSSTLVTVSVLCLSTLGHARPTERSPSGVPTVEDCTGNVIYHGTSSNGIESFLNIKFGQGTGGDNRFAAPKPFTYPSGSTVDASAPGAACPQQTIPFPGLDLFSNVTNSSEDCLTLRVDRPVNTTADAKLPVLLWIYGGGDTIGQIYDQAYDPTGLVLGSALKGTPVIYAAMNYRLGFLGFSAFPEGDTTAVPNAGLLDQRLAMQWVQDHVESFGGDPTNVTIFGESDGATAVGLHITAYGGSQPAPFVGAIMESGSATADSGVAGSVVQRASQELTTQLNCTNSQVNATVECLRAVPYADLLTTMINYELAVNPEAGFDVFKPTVDGTFVPAAPSELLRSGNFSKNISTIIGWNEDDGSIFVTADPSSFANSSYLASWIPTQFPGNMSDAQLQKTLELYNSSTFATQQSLYPEIPIDWFRASQIERDSGYTCPGVLMAQAINTSTYVFALNSSLFTPFLVAQNASFEGVTHFSDIPFVFNQAQAFNASDAQAALASQISESWVEFAYTGKPAANGALMDWPEAGQADNMAVRVIGTSGEGVVHMGSQLGDQDFELLGQRCAFWNSPELLAVYQS